MERPSVEVITLLRERVDALTAVEVQLHTGPMELVLIVIRTPLLLSKQSVREQHGPYGSVGALRDCLRKLFGEDAAHRVAHPSERRIG